MSAYPYKKRNIWSGVLFGLGFAAFIDEAVFHQLLHWHKFYDLSSTSIGLISDGFFHAFSWFATVGSLYMAADLRRMQHLKPKFWWSGKLIGAGGFQLYDGIIQHKLMRIHQIRYHVDLIYYDVIWNVIAVMMIMIGILLYKQANAGDAKELTQNA